MAALKAIIAKLDDVEEAFRGLYVKKGEQFALQVEGMKTEADVQAVQRALQAERAAHVETGKKLKDVEEKATAFGEMTPEQVQELQDKLATLEAAGTPELTKNFEKIVQDRVASIVDGKIKAETTKKDKLIGELQTQLGTVTKENEGLKLADVTRTIEDTVRGAAMEAKLLPGAVTDALTRARSAFQLQEGKVVTADGMTPQDWIEARKQDAAHWWPVARGAGGHGSDGNGNMMTADNPWTAGGWNITKQGQILLQDGAKAERLAAAAGSKVGATAPPPKA